MKAYMHKARETIIDELLVVRCQEGNRESFDLLIRRWQRRLWQYARRLTGSNDAAWDVVQETWMAILKQIRKLDDPAWFAAWDYRIVRNKCADHFRQTHRLRHLDDAMSEQQRTDARLPRRSHDNAMAQALRRLSTNRQELLALKYGENLSVVEIAVVLGLPAGTVKSRLHYAREELRRILEGEAS